MSTWNICAPGPSFDPDAIPDDAPTICINVALKKANHCDYWAAFDSPGALHLSAWNRFTELRPQVITDRSRVIHWEKQFRKSHMVNEDWPTIITPKYGPLWIKTAAKRGFYTMFGSISFIVQSGGTHIRIYGCDMAGDRYYDAEASQMKGSRAKAQRHWSTRWTKERLMMKGIIEAGEAHGITFEGVDAAKLAAT